MAKYRVALSGDFRKADGSPTFPDFDLAPLRSAPNVEMAFLDAASPLLADQLEDFDALMVYKPDLVIFGAGSARIGNVSNFAVPGLKNSVAMMGLDLQVEANFFNVVWGTVRNGCVILLLVAIPKLEAFFIWQLAVTLVCLGAARWRLQRTLFLTPTPVPYPFIDRAILLRIRGFASGVFLIALVAVVNTQLDRLVLSRLLDLEYLGYYNIAVAIGTGMLAIASPFVASIQPRLTLFFSSGEYDKAMRIYLNVATLVAILLYPMMAVIGLNAEMVVATWTGNADIARHSAALVPWVVIAYTLLSMQQMPFGVAME